MADEKEKVTNQEPDRASEGKKKELSPEELESVSGGCVTNENQTKS